MDNSTLEKQMTPSEVEALRESATQACSLLKLLANEDRLMILCLLTQGEKNVSDIQALTGIAQPTLSQQLTVLREEGVVSTTREGKFIFYQLTCHEVVQVMQTMSRLYCGKVLAMQKR